MKNDFASGFPWDFAGVFLGLLVVIILLILLVVGLFNRVHGLERVVSGHRQVVDEESKKRIGQSRAVILGQVAEHLAPLAPGFPWEPKDARFLGQPIDYIIFDGLSQGDDVSVVFVEVKTGSSRLNGHEKAIRAAIEAGRVRFEVYRPDQGLVP